MKLKKYSLFVLFFLLNLSQRTLASEIKPGFWRFELRTTHAVVPFVIEFKEHQKKLIAQLHNGKETISLGHIQIKDQQVSIPVQTYEITMDLKVESEKRLTGNLIRHNKNPEVKHPLVGVYGEKERYPVKITTPTIDLSGKWSLILEDEDKKKSEGVATLTQTGHRLNGSILTPTGDYRYLEGYVSGEEFEAASFDGVYNYIFKGRLRNGKLDASILSNTRTLVSGVKNPQAQLPDPYQETKVESLEFTFPDLEGKAVSLKDKRFANKPVIVVIYGSWCPNCLDEMNYLIPWYKKNHSRGIEVVTLAFERSLGEKEARAQLRKTEATYKIPYPVLLAGSTSEDKPKDKLPGLKNFISFPTTIFLDRKHQVVKVHAGFTGPSTGEFYQEWMKDFNNTVDALLRKK